ncbi:hypothetical protein [Dehalobacterium formicoaceticum]|uniref:Lipoprotein n=1 Tax=Dehalobacterium formicoaceticum TaxID=51515 RepID=A0ABT1Y4J0_9FIRM|nr:hypothetical protein [Dehalobacterium formicoaceticum]MCR6545792.1 hypothetical protein [Dehalobacterium formicoaceticum]
MKKLAVKITLLLLLMMALLITGCNNSTEPTPNPNPNEPPPGQEEPGNTEKPPEDKVTLGDYLPLTVGSTWQYLGEGNEYATFSREVMFAQGNRAQIKEDNGGTVSALVYEVTEDTITTIYSQGESYENENFLDAEPNDDLIILKTPLEVGTKWETKDGTREIIDLNASLDTPAGKFDQLIKVEIIYPDSTMYEYYKAGVGLIKREFLSEGFEVTSTLEKYEIK